MRPARRAGRSLNLFGKNLEIRPRDPLDLVERKVLPANCEDRRILRHVDGIDDAFHLGGNAYGLAVGLWPREAAYGAFNDAACSLVAGAFLSLGLRLDNDTALALLRAHAPERRP